MPSSTMPTASSTPVLSPSKDTIYPTSYPSCVPSTIPSGAPSAVPSFVPSCVPSLVPTSYPTFVTMPTTSVPSLSAPSQSEPSQTSRPTFGHFSYSTFNASAALKLFPKEGTTQALFAADSYTDYNRIKEAYSNFTSHENLVLYPSFEVTYTFLAFSQISVTPNNTYSSRFTCSDSDALTTFAGELVYGDTVMTCNNVIWAVQNGVLYAFDINTYATAPDPRDNLCAMPGDMSNVLPLNATCLKRVDPLPIKFAAMIAVGLEPTHPTPSISKLTVASLTSNTVVVNVRMTGYFPGGFVYCNSFYQNSPTSTSDIVGGYFYQDYIQTEHVLDQNVFVTVTGLKPVTSTTVYCYAEDFYGNGMLLDDVLKNPLNFTTPCCIGVNFVNSPVAVYGDVSIYFENVLTDVLSFVFVYKLEALPPTGILTVTPVLSDPAVSSYSTSFQPTDTDEYGTFILFADSSYSNPNLVVTLNLTGVDKNLFVATNATVSIISSKSPPPPPTLKSAGHELIVYV